MTEPLSPEVRALLLATLAKRIGKEEALAKAECSPRYELGTTYRFDTPLDEPLGLVQRTKPKTEWRVTDPAALEEHLAQFPGVVDTVYDVHTPVGSLEGLTGEDELVLVLREHAAHLLVERTQVNPAAVKDALEQSKATGEAAAPGIGKVRPGGQLRVVPDRQAEQAVQRWIASGRLDWPSLLALPSGQVAAS